MKPYHPLFSYSFIHLRSTIASFFWYFEKFAIEGAMPEHDTSDKMKDFLDKNQYATKNILRYEFIFGAGYISTGGGDTTLDITQHTLKPLFANEQPYVVDVGCGIGGGDAHLADALNCSVLGLDLSENVIAIAKDRYGDRKDLEFKAGDALTVTIPSSTVDLVYSRDSILHVKDKNKLFTNFYSWCKPGGYIFISDYCSAPKSDWSEEFSVYVDQRGYHLLTVDLYAAELEKCGFEVLKKHNKSEQFAEVLEVELERATNRRDEFITHFSEEEYDNLLAGWQSKISRVKKGEQQWGHFLARKPVK
eukprot:GHVN01072402.1.p1 GENE.GHVN01072402.1~~GHVN01072402.1.p1  ORF type:complete len:351 (-),score=43.07 GHVN01072402.1:261-1175(-)